MISGGKAVSGFMDYRASIGESIRFIDNNLTNDITLNSLAHQAHFSPFHYHRIFQSLVGEPVMEYVRHKRLLKASVELLAAESSLADTAYKYRFNSQDVFTRAFKRQFGVTPAAFRKINRRSFPSAYKENFKEVRIMLDPNFSQKLYCSHMEKKECLVFLEQMLELSQKARKHGLFSLESETPAAGSVFLRKAIQLVVDGIEPETVRTVLTNYILLGDFRGKQLLERLLILEGILSIQAGENPHVIKEKLSSFFGEDFVPEIEKHYGGKLENPVDKIRTYCDKIRSAKPLSPMTELLEKPLTGLPERSLQRLLRELEADVIAKALKGSGGKVQAAVLKNLSQQIAVQVIDEINGLDPVEPPEIARCQEQILKTIEKLRVDGDIL
jgi:AraC-like DNA-binding protein